LEEDIDTDVESVGKRLQLGVGELAMSVFDGRQILGRNVGELRELGISELHPLSKLSNFLAEIHLSVL